MYKILSLMLTNYLQQNREKLLTKILYIKQIDKLGNQTTRHTNRQTWRQIRTTK